MPTSQQREVQELLDVIERKKRELAQAEGALASVKRQMQEEFGVSTSDAAKRKIAALESEAQDKEAQARASLDEAKVMMEAVGAS
jgi:predicted RNase H-like nuclease (RuvC/YqgF family)